MSALSTQSRAELKEKLAEARANAANARDDCLYSIARWWESRAACLKLILDSDADQQSTMERT